MKGEADQVLINHIPTMATLIQRDTCGREQSSVHWFEIPTTNCGSHSINLVKYYGFVVAFGVQCEMQLAVYTRIGMC